MNFLEGYPVRVRFKNRHPDPGVCTVYMINWEKEHLICSNGTYSYFPSFDEIEIVEVRNV